MDAKELMIGNYVFHKTHGICTVTVVEQDACILLPIGGGNPFLSVNNDFYPIELNPSVLEACGFLPDTRDGGVWFQEKGYLSGYGVFIDKEQITLYKYNRFGIDTLVVDDRHFQHLHHFQNLIQYLTGSPLNVDAAKIM